MQGILIVNKPKGYSSFDCVAIIRRQTGEKRCGHTGTLDPDASGVLPVCVGSATRLIEYMDGAPKLYRCVCRLGVETDSYDMSGRVTGGVRSALAAGACPDFRWPQEEEISEALKGFTGEIEQRPPIFSAVKLNGKRLYSYAREGIYDIAVKPRKVTVYSIVLISYDSKAGELTMDISCSRGTYVRSICHELGQSLKTGAVMAELVRLSSAGFDISEALDLEKLRTMPGEAVEKLLYPAERAVVSLERVETDGYGKHLFVNGDPAFAEHILPQMRPEFGEGDDIAVFSEGVFLGTGKIKAEAAGLRLLPNKVIK